MLLDIIRKELTDAFYSLKFVFTFLLCTALILLSVFTGISTYLTDLREHEAAVALDRSYLENEASYRLLASQGLKIRKPPAKLSTVVPGIQDALGRVAVIKGWSKQSISDSKLSSNPVYAIFGALDLTYIVKIVLSLIAMLYTFDAVCGEKERGTLKLTMANDVPRDKLLLGKAAGSLVSLLISLGVPFLIGLLFLSFYPGLNLSLEEWQRLGMLSALYLLYISVFFTLGLMVSTLTSRPATSFLILLVAWVCIVSILPRTAVVAAGQIYPAPAVYEITAGKEVFRRDIHSSYVDARRRWIAEHANLMTEDPRAYKDGLDELTENMLKDNDKKAEEFNASLDADFRARRRAQQNITYNLSRISPASALMLASMSLGRTGIAEHQRFINSVSEFGPVWSEWVRKGATWTLRVEPEFDLSSMPRHSYEPESISDSIKRTIPDFVILMLFSVLFFTAAYVSFLHYDVR